MLEADHYNTIEKQGTATFSDRGSKFIAFAFPVDSIEGFKVILQQLKKEHPKASHFCFAYRIGTEGQTFRVSDAGEPAGSAGRPIIGQIDSKELTNVCVIVLRYFGGTLLGIPGLIHAYKSAASMALQLIPVVRKQIEVDYEIHFDYTISNDVMKILRQFECTIHKQEMQLFCVYEIGIPKTIEPACLFALQKIYGCTVKKKATK
jgi:uncharacterized YigZ family protein